ncbi:unnamed protein product [Hymenolepis diminuta]|uniref:Uncharacterized protein n=1 Tax=Hymenolepis diminuta TaxID=6216 RepID=A0A564Y060_HYMDI|nr:unnamed protein product [Hymenolepis diminuta]VUZ54137.1 unnamed protein product [Hymenolepis diminuta]
MTILRFFHLRSWSDVFYVPMTQNPYLSCLNTPIDSPFHNSLVSLKSTSARMFPRGLTQVIHIKLSLFFHPKHNARVSVTGSYVHSHRLCSSALSPLSSSSYSLQFPLWLP